MQDHTYLNFLMGPQNHTYLKIVLGPQDCEVRSYDPEEPEVGEEGEALNLRFVMNPGHVNGQ